jgi:hypothetical protein
LGIRDLPAPQWFNKTAGELAAKTLLRVQWYTAPYPRYYQVLVLYSDGSGGTWREVPRRGTQVSSHGRLSNGQQAKVRARLKTIRLGPTSPATPEDGQLHLVFTFRTDAGVIRHDFLGSVPREAQTIIDLVRDEIKAQSRAKIQERLKEILERRERDSKPTR